MSDFHRFPHTPHLAWLGKDSPRDDKVLSPEEARELLSGDVVVEEKLDGANLGFSVCTDGSIRAQNRGSYLHQPYPAQFSRLDDWMARHEDKLFDLLGEHLIAFGEWCAARHTLDYDALPDWWLMFDVYDRREQCFWSTSRRNALAVQLGVARVPRLHRGRTSIEQLRTWITTDHSLFRPGGIEGVVVRRESADWLLERAKLVHPDFTQAIGEHWRNRTIEWNRLDRAVLSSLAL